MDRPPDFAAMTHICERLAELRRISEEAGYPFLAYLIQMAEVEAQAVARGKGQRPSD